MIEKLEISLEKRKGERQESTWMYLIEVWLIYEMAHLTYNGISLEIRSSYEIWTHSDPL